MEPWKELGRAAPGPGEIRSLYVCPDRRNARIKAIICCNRSVSQAAIRLSLAQSETTIGLADWIFYNTPLYENDTLILSHEGEGLPIGPGQEIMCWSDTGTVSFKLQGEETWLKPPT